MYPRYAREHILAALKERPVVFVRGPRQSGKSTLAQAVMREYPDAKYVSFDDPTAVLAAQNDPLEFFNHPKGPLVVDEVQRTPELFNVIKLLVDRDRRPSRYLLTGSANVFLVPKLSDSLAGRMEIQTLLPLSIGELHGIDRPLLSQLFAEKNSPQLFERPVESIEDFDWCKAALLGGYPEVQTLSSEQRRYGWFNTHLESTLHKDVRELAQIDDGQRLYKLLRLLAARSGQLLNYESLARDSEIPTATVRRYLLLLKAVYLIDLLPAWSTNANKRITRSPKVHFLDTGLLCFLLGLNENGMRADRKQFGSVLESLVANELMKMATWSFPYVDLYHYRTHRNAEVDIVLRQQNGNIVGIEVKAASTITAADLKGLKSLREDAKGRFVRGIILYLGDATLPLGDNIWAVPLSSAFL